MARIRSVKPELFTHEGLFEAASDYQLPLQLAFIALFTQCDQWGRFRWQPKRLKLSTLPYHDVDMAGVLDALAARGFIKKYAVEGEYYGCIPSWSKHQKITKPEHASGIPSPGGMIPEKPIRGKKDKKASLPLNEVSQFIQCSETVEPSPIFKPASQEFQAAHQVPAQEKKKSPTIAVSELSANVADAKDSLALTQEEVRNYITNSHNPAKELGSNLAATDSELIPPREQFRDYLTDSDNTLIPAKEELGSNLSGTKEVLGSNSGGTCLLRNMEYGIGNMEYGTRNRKGRGEGRENQTTFLSHLRCDRSIEEDPLSFIFEHWKAVMHHPTAQMDGKRRKLILNALKMGYTREQLCEAITGCSLTPHNIGQNDRGQRYDGLQVILRDSDQIDRFMHNYHYPPRVLSEAERRTQTNVQSLQRWVNQKMAEVT